MSSTSEIRQIEIPASLDLVARAELGINGILSTLDPELDYEGYSGSFFYSRPQYMRHSPYMMSGVMPKYLEALALLRCMTGSSHLKDIEQGLIQSVLSNLAEDGLIYDRQGRRPWNSRSRVLRNPEWFQGIEGWSGDYANVAGNGRLLCAMDFYYQLTGDELWKRQMQRTAERLLELALIKEDYAYYPGPDQGLGDDFSWHRGAGWVNKDEPGGPREGREGAVTFYQAQPIRGWVRWYKHSGDERMLDIARRFARFAMKPKFWGQEDTPEHERLRGHWSAHGHGDTAALRGILEYALLAEDYRALEFVRDAWEWHRQQRFDPRIGWAYAEGCVFGDLPALAIQLSDAGLGDFWDDADVVARNTLPEAQFTDAEGLRALGELAQEKWEPEWWKEDPAPGEETTERVVERNLGAIAWQITAGLVQEPVMGCCCMGNALQAFYYVWEAAVRHAGGLVTVNFFFTRFSPWLDLISYLPYEGKVEIRNKTAHRISVRIPAWIPRAALKCNVDGQPAVPEWQGRYAQFDGLKGAETIILEFPLKKETLYLPVDRIRAEFRGTTCLSTAPVDESFMLESGSSAGPNTKRIERRRVTFPTTSRPN